MDDANLTFEALRRIRKARRRNTLVIIGCLPLLYFGGNYAVNNESSQPLWLSLVGLFVGLTGIALSPYLNFNFGDAKCPKCGELLERNQFIGKKLPEKCSSCGLVIDIFVDSHSL